MSIALRGIAKQFGEFAAVKNIDLDVPTGALIALLGPSGCGKTTLPVSRHRTRARYSSTAGTPLCGRFAIERSGSYFSTMRCSAICRCSRMLPSA
jgi:ABC-type branched-subunit amino acid transport system ATPase component